MKLFFYICLLAYLKEKLDKIVSDYILTHEKHAVQARPSLQILGHYTAYLPDRAPGQ